MRGIKPNKQYRNYELKDRVLKSIFDGHITVSDIFNHIQYKGKVNYLTIELRGLYETGCIGRKWISGEYQYHLLEKGRTLIHNGADYYAKFRRQQMDNIIKNEVESTLANNEKFANAVQMYARSHFSNPIIVPPQRPEVDPEGLNRGGAGQPINIQLPVQSPDLPNSINPLNNDNTTRINDDFLKTLLEDSSRLKKLETHSNNRPVGDESVLNERIKQLEEENRNMAMQLQYNLKPTEYVDKKSGDVLTPAEMQIVQSKAQQKNNQYKANAERRRMLVKKYKGYLLDANFFKEWGGLYPYWIKHFGLFKPGSIEILSPSNDEIKLRDHSKGKVEDKDILRAELQFHSIANDGIWINGIGMVRPRLIKYGYG